MERWKVGGLLSGTGKIFELTPLQRTLHLVGTVVHMRPLTSGDVQLQTRCNAPPVFQYSKRQILLLNVLISFACILATLLVLLGRGFSPLEPVWLEYRMVVSRVKGMSSPGPWLC